MWAQSELGYIGRIISGHCIRGRFVGLKPVSSVKWPEMDRKSVSGPAKTWIYPAETSADLLWRVCRHKVSSKGESSDRSERNMRAEMRMKVKAKQEPERMHMGTEGSKIDIEMNSGVKWWHMGMGFHQTGLAREKRKGVKTHRIKEEDGALVACLLLGQAGGLL